MKVFKRNAVIITVLLFVCVAVYLNWSYNRGQDLSVDANTEDTADVAESADPESSTDSGDENTAEDGSAGLYYDEESTDAASGSAYFDSARLTREQARDQATALLQEAATVETASQEEIDSAMSAITAMANYLVQEAQVENILVAKEFTDCVVFISEGKVTVTVPAPVEGLTSESVAVIQDTAMSELGVTAEQITIIEVK